MLPTRNLRNSEYEHLTYSDKRGKLSEVWIFPATAAATMRYGLMKGNPSPYLQPRFNYDLSILASKEHLKSINENLSQSTLAASAGSASNGRAGNRHSDQANPDLPDFYD